MLVQEHTSDYLGKKTLRRAGDSCIIQQVASRIFWLCKQVIGKPAHHRLLGKAPFCLQQFHALQDAAELILPATACCQELFQDEGTITYLVLIPCQAAEIAQCTKNGRGQQTARSESAARRNGRKRSNLDTTAKDCQLFFQ